MNKAAKNILASVLPQIVNIISNLILPGIIIAKFGSEMNGLVSTTKSIISYISIVGAGIATAVTQALYKPVAEKETETVKGMLHAANKMFLKFGLIYVAITLVVSVIYPFCLDTEIEPIIIVLLLIVMSLSGASEFFVVGRCRALLYANQQVYISSVIQAVSLLLSLGFALFMLFIDANIILVECAISFVYIARAGFLLAYVNIKYPQYRNFRKVPPIASTVAKRKDAMVHQLAGLAVTGSQGLILTMCVGLEAASIYSVYYIVFNGLQSICANLGTALTPYLGREIALGNTEKTAKIYELVEYGFCAITSFVYSVTMVMLIPFVTLYTKGADINYSFTSFAVLFGFSSMFFVCKMPSTNAINAAGFFKETRWRAIVEALLCVIIGIVMSLLIGQDGVLIGTFVALAWRCLDTILYSNKHVMHQKNRQSLLRLLRTIGIVGAFAVFSVLLPIESLSVADWVIQACLFSLVAVILVALDAVIFERKMLSEWIIHFKKRRERNKI